MVSDFIIGLKKFFVIAEKIQNNIQKEKAKTKKKIDAVIIWNSAYDRFNELII